MVGSNWIRIRTILSVPDPTKRFGSGSAKLPESIKGTGGYRTWYGKRDRTGHARRQEEGSGHGTSVQDTEWKGQQRQDKIELTNDRKRQRTRGTGDRTKLQYSKRK